MIPFKINQTVKVNDGRVGRVLFYIYSGYHQPAPDKVVVLFVNKWADTFPFSDLTSISQDEHDEAVEADKKAVEAILANIIAT